MMLERITFMVRGLVIVFFISLAMLANAHGATYYVSKSGSNSNSCATAQSPGSSAKLTIAAGSQCLQNAGDQLLIQAGTYTETMQSGVGGFTWRNGTSGAYTRYARYQKDSVVIKPNSGSFVAYFNYPPNINQFIELDGLILDGSNISSAVVKIDGDGTQNSHHIRIKNGEIRNAGANTQYNFCYQGRSDEGGGAMGLLSGDGVEVLNNEIHHNTCYGFYGGLNSIYDGNRVHDNGAYGFHIYNSGGGINNAIIRNNIIYNNGYNSDRGGAAVLLASGSNHIVYNNVIHHNSSGIVLDFGCTGCKVYNNTIYGSTDPSYGYCIGLGSASNTDIRNNICWQNPRNTPGDGNGQASGTTLLNNLTSNPNFVNPNNADFHLQVGSPAIDKGLTISTVTNDSDGKPRPQGAAYDIGAYEYIKGLLRPGNFRIVSR